MRHWPCSGAGLQSSRPAYSPDAFDDSAKKGSKLAQRLLGGGKAVTGKLMPDKKLTFGSHVAGRCTHHKWADSFDSGGLEATSSVRAAEVQQVSISSSIAFCVLGTHQGGVNRPHLRGRRWYFGTNRGWGRIQAMYAVTFLCHLTCISPQGQVCTVPCCYWPGLPSNCLHL